MENKSNNWLQKPIHPALPAITNEIALFAGIILLALVTRFYDLGTRVMSHDESLHTYFSWLLYRGQGYQHTPMMHGPFQFHIISLVYFLFGVSDFTARIPAVLFSIATVWMVWYWRGYLGKWGAIVAGLLMVISPYMLYYGRYVRNESYAGFAGILLLYAVLHYLNGGEKRYLWFITAATILHFTAKETAFIYTAQILVFLGILFIVRVTSEKWEDKHHLYSVFIILLAAAVVLAGVGAGFGYINRHEGALSNTETAAPADPTTGIALPSAPATVSISTILFVTAFFLLLGAVILLIFGYGWTNLLKERSFDIIILLMTFVLPMLVALPLEWFESRLNIAIPTDAASVAALDTRAITIIGIFVAVLFAISILVGLLWSRDWWKYAALFWGVFTILYTTVFTNAPGFFTGLIGSLGYWLVQQGVERGSQPQYYYVLIQIPIYEFMTAIGSVVAIILGVKKLFGRKSSNPESPAETVNEADLVNESASPVESNFGTFFSLLVFWVVTSIITFSIAGERMPWLTYHMAWPMVLLTGWGIGQIIEGMSEKLEGETSWWRTALSLFVMVVFLLGAFNAIRAWYSATPPFQGSELVQLQATSAFLFPFLAMLLSGALLVYLMKDDLIGLGIVSLFILAIGMTISTTINGAALMTYLSVPEARAGMTPETLRFAAALAALIASIIGMSYLSRLPRSGAFVSIAALITFALLAVQTGRTAFRASYISYDDATEYLVYAHGATGIKDVMTQVEEISERTAGGLNAIVAYDASAPDTGVSWPFVWYLRDFTALRSFDSPTRSLREAVAVIVDQKNFDKIHPALGNEFYEFDYIRMWWPNQDYFNLDRTRVLNAITNPNIREGIFDIWFDRDYTKYSQAVGSSSMTLTTWQPADQMKLFVRKDVASKIWNYGVGPSEAALTQDPYEGGRFELTADQIFGSERYPLGLNAPRAIAPGRNADFYIADSRNHRILHIASDGSLLHQWGSFADAFTNDAPIGTFNEPWGIAVGPDGSVYVSDTWNHRIQKFRGDGTPVKMWGQYGQPLPGDSESASSFWGPRGVAVDSRGNVLVADTGNKRIVIFDEDGNYITEFGTAGFDPGQFDEPVGVAVAPSGTVYVTDTWNQRIQAFAPSEDGTFYFPTLQWDVNGWFGQSLDNKPFIAVGANEHVFITDPEGYRIIEFTSEGQFVRTWGDFGSGPGEIGLASGVTVDQLGFVWVTDAGNNRILRYRLP
ncbi:MAG TPA: flippase activity-associated protein Agl23 [Anaerolineales bacterium]|nr:flippase activity-associated protein Agl23 [Anaerolineales bacterium]